MVDREPLTKDQVADAIKADQADKAGLLDNHRRLSPSDTAWDNSFGIRVRMGYVEYRGYVAGLLQGSGQIGHDFANRLRRMDVDDFEAAVDTFLTPEPLSNYEKMSPEERGRIKI